MLSNPYSCVKDSYERVLIRKNLVPQGWLNKINTLSMSLKGKTILWSDSVADSRNPLPWRTIFYFLNVILSCWLSNIIIKRIWGYIEYSEVWLCVKKKQAHRLAERKRERKTGTGRGKGRVGRWVEWREREKNVLKREKSGAGNRPKVILKRLPLGVGPL